MRQNKQAKSFELVVYSVDGSIYKRSDYKTIESLRKGLSQYNTHSKKELTILFNDGTVYVGKV